MKTIILDIDSTISDPSHRLHYIDQSPPNWDAFFEACDGDTPMAGVLDMVLIHQLPFNLLFITGRPERTRQKTKVWLESQGFYRAAYTLLMRADGDHRKDYIVKPELLREYQKTVDLDIICAYDDSPEVCEEYRKMGIKTYQVMK